MNALSQREAKPTSTSPSPEVWGSSEDVFSSSPVAIIVLGAPEGLQVLKDSPRFSALTGILDRTFWGGLSLVSEARALSRHNSLEKYFIEALTGSKSFHVKLKSFDLFHEKHFTPYDRGEQVQTGDLWSSLITCESDTSASETIAALFRSNENSSAVTTNKELFEWLLEPKTLDPLADFEKYGTPNWDGYDAEPIKRETLDAARSFLRMLPDTFGTPDVAPGSDGTIGLEWVFADGPLKKLFIDIGPGRVWSAYWRRASEERGDTPHEKITSRTKDALGKLFDYLSA